MAEFISDKISHIVLRDSWCDKTVLNVHVQTEDETGDKKNSFYVEVQYVFD
jgi:hypothetical protein